MKVKATFWVKQRKPKRNEAVFSYFLFCEKQMKLSRHQEKR